MGIAEILLVSTFLGVLVLISLGKIDKSTGGILGSILVFLILLFTEKTRFTLSTVIGFINFGAILTIVSIFISVEVLQKSGFFHWLGIRGIKATKGEPYPLLLLLCFTSSILSGFITAIAVGIYIP